ncbi:hypothetical protein PS914_03214 [Pseudomonas fluorescens]|uniref:hypothetical protein n=1 Tax=Pseudomonas fluorescens TaxID=294 RepID=UPI00123F183A|nr:hypothetical protein [Pseudomonas fluorescens]VVP91962.1 hypothetical protein PS914_03214 [Pseudomonas fluorescens]
MSNITMYTAPIVANALPYSQLKTAPETIQAVADYTANYIGTNVYNNATGILGNAHTWLFMGMTEPQFQAQVDHFFGV